MSDAEHRTIHDPEWWTAREAELSAQLAQFDGLPYAEVTDDTRTDMLIMTMKHLVQLHVAVRALALEGHPKRVHARKPATKRQAGGDGR